MVRLNLARVEAAANGVASVSADSAKGDFDRAIQDFDHGLSARQETPARPR